MKQNSVRGPEQWWQQESWAVGMGMVVVWLLEIQKPLAFEGYLSVGWHITRHTWAVDPIRKHRPISCFT